TLTQQLETISSSAMEYPPARVGTAKDPAWTPLGSTRHTSLDWLHWSRETTTKPLLNSLQPSKWTLKICSFPMSNERPRTRRKGIETAHLPTIPRPLP